MKKLSIERFNVVLFWYMNDWGMYGRAYEKIAENLAMQDSIDRVFCILPPENIGGGYRFFPFVLRRISKKLNVMTPNLRVIPSRFAPGKIGKNINERFIRFSYLNFLKYFSYNERNTILWVFPPHPYIIDLKREVPHMACITQFVDSNIYKKDDPPEKIEFVKKQYQELANTSDMVITSSELNFNYFSPLNRNTYLFENAVDPIFLGDPSNFPYVGTCKRPRLGYSGYISQRTDINLLGYIANLRPEYDLILAGPVEISKKEFEKLMRPNVYYEGIIAYEKMPSFLKGLDICLIPHYDTNFSRSMNPLKLFQYLATGRPIVSTRVAGVDRWSNLISIAENYDDFISKIDETIKNDTIDQSRKRVEAARLETWDKRVKEMLDVISQVIKNGHT